MNDLEELKQQHINNYRKAIVEIIKNNTNSLVDDDITSLIRIPPLDSMDQIKSKFLVLAKKEKVILETDILNKIILDFRNNLVESLQQIKDIRIECIVNNVNKIKLERDNDIIKITKKDLAVINRKLKNKIKLVLDDLVQSHLIKNIPYVFSKEIDNDKKEKIIKELIKFLNNKGAYQKQLLENIDFKILVKDTTLINGIKEQSDRYLFTKNNSRLFN